MSFLLKEGAWFFADAHYTPERRGIDVLLRRRLEEGSLPEQIILMGDIFDLLFGESDATIKRNRPLIETLRTVARYSQLLYLEGNHDFGLKRLFGDVMQVVPRCEQPLMATWMKRRVALHHGDWAQGLGYALYTALIRTKGVVGLLDHIDRIGRGLVVDWLVRHRRQKALQLCQEVDLTKRIVAKIGSFEEFFACDYWIEGHHHQNLSLKLGTITYWNLPAFACGQRWMVLKRDHKSILFEEKEEHGSEKGYLASRHQ